MKNQLPPAIRQPEHDPRIRRGLELKAVKGRLTYARQTWSFASWWESLR